MFEATKTFLDNYEAVTKVKLSEDERGAAETAQGASVPSLGKKLHFQLDSTLNHDELI